MQALQLINHIDHLKLGSVLNRLLLLNVLLVLNASERHPCYGHFNNIMSTLAAYRHFIHIVSSLAAYGHFSRVVSTLGVLWVVYWGIKKAAQAINLAAFFNLLHKQLGEVTSSCYYLVNLTAD